MKLQMKSKNQGGFTLLEILLVVAAIAILAGIVILALNPNKQLADTRNAQRRADVNTVLSAVYQFAIDNDGSLPSSIATSSGCSGVSTNEICQSDATSCSGLIDLTDLTTNEEYLTAIPSDPTGSSTNGAGYHIAQSTNGRVTVCAPDAEQGATIEVTR